MVTTGWGHKSWVQPLILLAQTECFRGVVELKINRREFLKKLLTHALYNSGVGV